MEGYTLILRGFFLYIIRQKDQRSYDGKTGVWGHNMINMTIRELLYTFADFFPKLEFLFIILILPKGTAKLRWGEGGDNIFFRVQRSSVGCSVAQ